MKRLYDTNGSLTVETAILFPILIAVLLFGCVGISYCVRYCQVEQCFYQTAEVMADYAYLYHEKTISTLTADWKESMGKELDLVLTEVLTGVPEELQEVFDLKSYLTAYGNDLLDQGESQIYIPIAKSIFQYYLRQSGLEDVVEAVNFSNSTFFIKEHEILLDVICKLPFQAHYRICVNGWVNGIGGREEATDDIWELDNFTRGQKIRKIYGGNLPNNFPVIAKFENGQATMIKSVDFRKETYQTEGALSANIITMLQTLYAYQGQTMPYGTDKIVILPSQIKKKELLLVIPNAAQSNLIQQELYQAELWAKGHKLIFTIAKL